MSWARFGCEGSDVYLFPTGGDGPGEGLGECCDCLLHHEHPDQHPAFYQSPYLDAFLAHLDQHRAAGHLVPDSAYAQVRGEWDEYVRPAR